MASSPEDLSGWLRGQPRPNPTSLRPFVPKRPYTTAQGLLTGTLALGCEPRRVLWALAYTAGRILAQCEQQEALTDDRPWLAVRAARAAALGEALDNDVLASREALRAELAQRVLPTQEANRRAEEAYMATYSQALRRAEAEEEQATLEAYMVGRRLAMRPVDWPVYAPPPPLRPSLRPEDHLALLTDVLIGFALAIGPGLLLHRRAEGLFVPYENRCLQALEALGEPPEAAAARIYAWLLEGLAAPTDETP